MNSGNHRLPGGAGSGPMGPMAENRHRIEYAKRCIEELAREAGRLMRNGTIGVEIPVQDGKLGKVKRLLIDFQSE